MKLRAIIVALTLWALSPPPGFSQQSPAESNVSGARPEVLVLGVYHMANPGSHVVNVEADDVLSSRRQAEIAEVMAVLKTFQPTKITVEADFHDEDVISSRYSHYLNGGHELTRNERQQIGFRLAKELGHTTVYSVDADGDFPFPRVEDYAKTHGHTEEFDALMGELRERAEVWNAYLASHSVLEALLYMNSDGYAAQSLAFDYQMAHLGEPWNWAGPDLVTDWFRRNIRIYSNVLQLIDSPDERVLVIFGAGHLGWLRHNFATDPNVRLRKLAEFAR
jgi:hypothetical protein